VVIGVPADDEPWSEDDDEALVPVSLDEALVPVSLDEALVPVSLDEDVVVVFWLCATVVEVCVPIEPETPITPKAIANVASEVAQTRRRMARSLAPRTRSFSAASSRGVGVGFMHPMVGRQSKHLLKAGWEVAESAQ
jgi:hypothetical protein